MNLMLIFIASVITHNMVLTYFLGICPFIGVSNKMESAIGMGMAVTFVMTLAAMVTWLIYHYLLVPFGVEFLQYAAFVLVIASLLQLVEMFIRKMSPELYHALGIYLPLITTNCAVLGVALLNTQEHHGFMQSALYGFGAAVGFSMVLILFAAMRERVAVADVPEAFKGNAIALITAGLMSLAFMGFSGLIKI